jgi:hypothetical protein
MVEHYPVEYFSNCNLSFLPEMRKAGTRFKFVQTYIFVKPDWHFTTVIPILLLLHHNVRNKH